MFTWRHPNRPFLVGRPFAATMTAAIVGAIVVVVAPATSAFAANSPPVGNDDSATTLQNQGTAPIHVLDNDTDADGNTLTVTNLTNGTNGTSFLFSDMTVQYIPNTGFVGTDTFTYTPNDGTVDGNVTTVTVTVQPAIPTAASYTTAVTEGRTTPPMDVVSKATNPCGGSLTVSITSPPAFGTASVANNAIVYTAEDQTATNADKLRYTVTDSCGHTSADATGTYKIRFAPIFSATATNADPHKADAKVTVTIFNPQDGAGADPYKACITNTGICQTLNGVPDGQSGSLVFTGFRENTRVFYTVATVGDPANGSSIFVFVKPVVHFTASIAKFAVKSGVHRGRAKVNLLNYWSGKSVLIYVRDGYGSLHKYSVAKEKNVTVYVPTPHGTHKVTVYRYYSGSKHRVGYRYVVR